MKTLPNIHPGEILNEEFLKPLNISSYRLAKETKMQATRISEIIKGRRRITADTALRLATFFGTTSDFWLGLQTEYELREEKKKIGKELKTIRSYKSFLASEQRTPA
ncbi:MAG: addiction module antidote protein, HigA family [Candidatus Electrothrix sp. MAN1_4]|nr:addiction module antidote protein, HigA family [Candidatus Electrothrix sp. MAN1_4]